MNSEDKKVEVKEEEKKDACFGSEIKVTENVKLELFDSEGRRKDVREIHNTTTALGKELLADQLLASPTVAKPGWMEVGTSTPTASLLGSYISGSRTALSSKTRAGNVVTFVCLFAAGVGSGKITEAGLFNVATQNNPVMMLSASFAPMTKGATDTLTITWTFTVN